MSTPPVSRPAGESQRRQRRYLVGAAVVVTSLIAALAILDRAGSSRYENRERSNPEQTQGSNVPPTTSR
jgi:hypothetical protein